MTNLRRLKSDISTIDKREMADRTKSDNRNRNDALTQERRFEADKTMTGNRARNDEMTANRREIKDGNAGEVVALSLLVLIVLSMVVYFAFF